MKLVERLPAAEPLRVTPERRARLEGWITQEIEDAFSARRGVEKIWRDSMRLYEATPKLPVRTTPVENAPNIEVPLGAIASDAIYAQATDLIYNISPVVTARSNGPAFVQHAKAYQRWVNWIAANELAMRQTGDDAMLDDIQLGTGVLYVPFVERVKKTKVHEVKWRGPRMFSVPLEDFLVPGGLVPDLQWSRFLGMRQWLGWTDLVEQARAGLWTQLDRVQPAGGVDWVRLRREQMGRTSSDPRQGEIFELFRLWLHYDFDEDGIDEDLYVVWDRTSRAALRIRYNPYDWRPFAAMRYQIRAHLFYGLGVIEMMRPFQEEATELHNHRTLNLMLANARVWATRAGQVPDSVRMWMGKTLALSNPKEDLVPLAMADVYPSAFQAEALTIALAERRVGVNDLTAPRPQNILGSRTPGITALSLLQQASKRFAPAFDGMRLAYAGAVQQAVLRYQERLLAGDLEASDATRSIFDVLDREDAERVVSLLRSDSFDEAVAIELTASSASVNRESDRQNAILLANIMTQYYERLINLAVVASNPQVPEALRTVARRISDAAGELADRTLRSFEQVRDPETLVVSLTEVFDELDQRTQTGVGSLGRILEGLTQQAIGSGGEAAGGPLRVAGNGRGAGPPEGV